ncbi:toxin RelE2 [Brucella sp. NBRC 12952]|uniref:Type II toxin-antitoxin system RelE/ParE family toxin n=1 Tax=Brucella pseudogrignonensis TaxID=419475 RepID=A0A7Y3T9E8_9HYPH|nr:MULTISPECIES: type II toxin-antitoxin system RelE/ParE family toxin [Brucella]NNV23243.1 type II toxin-antitoxin system RelE/ParE family toxin [Brucella pseudogrignonensis]
MTAPTLRWTRRAVRRLDQIGAYIAKDNPDAAARIVTRIVSAVENLASYPSMGRPGRIKGTREYVFADIPYVIAYRLQSGVVEIITVIHGAQKWPLELTNT